MKLRATRKTFHFADPSGYAFTVEAEERWQEGRGWYATLTMRSGGMVTAEDAVMALKDSAEHFLRQLRNAKRASDRAGGGE